MSFNACILSIGTELTAGINLDTNSKYLARQFFLLGIDVKFILNLPDDYRVLAEKLNTALKESSLVVLTGGLGPTRDDITKDVVKDVMHLEMQYSQDIYKTIEKRFSKRGYAVPESNKSQAFIFKKGETLLNTKGTAPGFIIRKNRKTVVLLPGPPSELIPMFEKDVKPFLIKNYKVDFFYKVIRLFGLPESLVADKLNDVDDEIKKLKGNITYLANPDFIDIIVSSKYNISKIKLFVKEIKTIFRHNIFSTGWNDFYTVVCNYLKKKGLTISLAESCTGGFVGKTLTDYPGSSQFFKFGIVSYSNKAKMKLLKVKKLTLQKYGAVSEQTAREMLNGLQVTGKTDISISTTGIAGPTGGSVQKPVGLVYIGVLFNNKVNVFKYNFGGARDRVRLYTLNKVFELLYQIVVKENDFH